MKVAVNEKLFWFFLYSVFLPPSLGVNIGGLRLNPYRIALIIFLLTSTAHIFRSLNKGFRDPGFLLTFYALWGGLAMAVNHGLASTFESSAIFLIETIGPFFIITGYCTDAKRIDRLVKALIVVAALTLLISLPEAITGKNWFKEVLRPLIGGGGGGIDKRMGLFRATGVFTHPILYGLVMGAIVGLAWYNAKKIWFFAVTAAAMTSLSSGAIVAIWVQGLLIGWDKITRSQKKRWLLLAALLAAAYIAIDLISNRSAMRAIISNVTMSPHTAYWRMLIWQFGMDNVYANPVFGIGFNDWERPSWMYSGSMDAYWLVCMVRYGLLGFLFYASAILIIVIKLFKSKFKDKRLNSLRRGWLVGMMGAIVSCSTVHIWNNAYIFFHLYVGLGAAMLVALKREDVARAKDRIKREDKFGELNDSLARVQK